MYQDACCTCAALLSTLPVVYDEKTEKPLAPKQLDCCGRVVCMDCLKGNERFGVYCLFCQVSASPSSLPQGLRDPPAYFPPLPPKYSMPTPKAEEELPPYASKTPYRAPNVFHCSSSQGKIHSSETAEDVLHFLDFRYDTVLSLSLRYGVPMDALKRANGLWSDHLLSARRAIVIPSEYYKGGVSLSPRPVEGEEEIRKAKVRRWMVACKVSEYDLALIYLNECNYDLEAAIDSYKADESWELDHPSRDSHNEKSKTKKEWLACRHEQID